MLFTPKNKFTLFRCRQLFYWQLKRNFAGIHLKNYHNVANVISHSQKENIPVLFCSNHPGWWDMRLAIYLCDECFKIDANFLSIGVEPIEKKFIELGVLKFDETPEEIMAMGEHLRGNSKFLWVFPQSKISDNSEAKFSPVVSELVENLKDVILVNCLFEYSFTNKKYPEIFIDFFESKNFSGISYLNKESFTKNLEQKFEFKMKEFAQKSDGNINGDYKKILEGRSS